MKKEAIVEHDPSGKKFFVRVGQEEAVLLYRQEGGTLDFYRTFVPESARGKGLAERLALAGFAFAEEIGAKVVPSCPYISGAFLERHPEWKRRVKGPDAPG